MQALQACGGISAERAVRDPIFTSVDDTTNSTKPTKSRM
jgi:hypothetical protein